MSKCVEFVVGDPARVPGLVEEFASWGEECVSFDPPRYVFGELRFALVPLAKHVQAALPGQLQCMKQCLELDERVVLNLSTQHKDAMRALVSALTSTPRQFALVYDPNEAGRSVLTNVAPQDVITNLCDAIEASDEGGLRVFVVGGLRGGTGAP